MDKLNYDQELEKRNHPENFKATNDGDDSNADYIPGQDDGEEPLQVNDR